jgi:serine/threonine-protein kinase RsbW
VGPRRFVARALDGCPAAEDAVLCVSELASNAIQHTRSGLGGRFQVIVWRSRASACLAVLDDGGYGHPAPPPAPGSAGLADLAESGHGIRVVEHLADSWGHQFYRDGPAGGRAVWCHLTWPARQRRSHPDHSTRKTTTRC